MLRGWKTWREGRPHPRGSGDRDGREEVVAALEDAKSFSGVACPDQGLGEDERVFLVVRRASLLRGRGRGRGGAGALPGPSSGLRPVNTAPFSREWPSRLRSHTVDADLRRDAVESGNLFVTNERVLFLAPSTSVSVPFGLVRQIDRVRRGALRLVLVEARGALTLGYGPAFRPIVESRIDLALAHYRGDVPALVRKLEDQLADLDAGGRRPRPR